MSCGQISTCDLYHKCGIITSDDIKLLHTTPFQLVQNFGAGTCIIILCLCIETRPITTPYTTGGDIIMYIGDEELFNVLRFNIKDNNKNVFNFRLPYDSENYEVSVLENKGIYIKNIGDPYDINGDHVIHYNIAFGIMPMHKSNI